MVSDVDGVVLLVSFRTDNGAPWEDDKWVRVKIKPPWDHRF